MARSRQNTQPVAFNRSLRQDQGVLMSSGRAGVVQPILQVPLFRGDSCAGRIGVTASLAEMPRPLLNAVFANFQVWFVPKSAHPQFAGYDEFMNSWTGEAIRALGQANRTPPPFFTEAVSTTFAASAFCKALGLHVPSGEKINTDLMDAFSLIYNFRLQAHSTKLPLRAFYSEDPAEACAFPRAFWPSGRYAKVVPDYERALVIGSLDLDVTAGDVPVRGWGHQQTSNSGYANGSTPPFTNLGYPLGILNGQQLIAQFNGETVTTSLADIDKARTTQAFAKLRTAYAGNDPTGFVSDDTIIAHLMQGLSVPEDQFKRPWLLDSKRVPFGFAERFATDSTALDVSVTTGQVSANLSVNVPNNDVGGYIIATVEILPERLDERQYDDYLHVLNPEGLPNALRDIQNPEPVDFVYNKRLDVKHTAPNGLYGYEPMNDRWNRSFTRLGGAFYQPDPANPWTEQRSGIWLASPVDPVFSEDHYLAPADFPHYPFADTAADAYELVCRHSLKIVGLTQIGDVLAENNDDYAEVAPSEALSAETQPEV